MVEIRCGEYSERADLTGKNVAEAREQYKSEFEIPDRAQAILNDKALKRKAEDKVRLRDNDELSFEERERSRKPIFVSALLLALAISGGLFAYTGTTTSVSIGVTAATSDFANVTSNLSGSVTYQPFGRYRGNIPAGNLFDVTPAADYNGDLEVTVYLANPDELTQNYRFWLMRIDLQNGSGTRVDAQGESQVLSLDNGRASFYWPSSNYTAGTPYYIESAGGSYIGLPWVGSGWSDTFDPLLFVEVTQAGLSS